MSRRYLRKRFTREEIASWPMEKLQRMVVAAEYWPVYHTQTYEDICEHWVWRLKG